MRRLDYSELCKNDADGDSANIVQTMFNYFRHLYFRKSLITIVYRIIFTSVEKEDDAPMEKDETFYTERGGYDALVRPNDPELGKVLSD
jgi:hypothetical protein